MTRSLISISLVAISLAACGGSSTKPEDFAVTTKPADMTATSTTDLYAVCGHPGDTGNSKGVGVYCGSGETACVGSAFANVCSSLGNDPTDPSMNSYFCTAVCSATSPAGFCGENASCVCKPQGCGCIPAACVPPDLGT